ncbi:MAG: NADH-quinone oxidoreductase subunit E, partial [Pseudomonadota bacterium]
ASKELARVLADTNAKIADGRGVSRPAGGYESDPQGEVAVADAPAPKKAEAPAAPAKAPTAEAEAEKPARPEPKPAAEPAAVDEAAPETLAAARESGADDLKKISGVGPKLEGVLNEMGFFHFDQIAAWTPEHVAWVDARLKFKGRIERDDWIAQAAELAKGGN